MFAVFPSAVNAVMPFVDTTFKSVISLEQSVVW